MSTAALTARAGAASSAILPQRAAPLRQMVAVTLVSHVPSGMHSGAVAIALAGYAVFLIASWIGWAFGYTALLVTVVYGLSLVYFGMLVGLGRSAAFARGDVDARSFRDFLQGRVATLTGAVGGRDALVQVAFMPVVLGILMAFFAIAWLTVAH